MSTCVATEICQYYSVDQRLVWQCANYYIPITTDMWRSMQCLHG